MDLVYSNTGKDCKGVVVKLQYEWKNIYRSLNNNILSEGIASKKVFEDALTVHGVHLTQPEMAELLEKYGDGRSKLDFTLLSKRLGLHSTAITQISNI